jgi:hypothetical protein
VQGHTKFNRSHLDLNTKCSFNERIISTQCPKIGNWQKLHWTIEYWAIEKWTSKNDIFLEVIGYLDLACSVIFSCSYYGKLYSTVKTIKKKKSNFTFI